MVSGVLWKKDKVLIRIGICSDEGALLELSALLTSKQKAGIAAILEGFRREIISRLSLLCPPSPAWQRLQHSA